MKISYLQVVSCRLYDVFSVSRAVSSVYVCQCEWTMIIQLDDLWPRYCVPIHLDHVLLKVRGEGHSSKFSHKMKLLPCCLWMLVKRQCILRMLIVM